MQEKTNDLTLFDGLNTMSSTVRQSRRHSEPRMRYTSVGEAKANGITYTPKILADFVSNQIVDAASLEGSSDPLRVLDPAVGDGQLVLSLLRHLSKRSNRELILYGFDTSREALTNTEQRLMVEFPQVSRNLYHESFLAFVSSYAFRGSTPTLFEKPELPQFDLIIANPPYVRTQIIGAESARELASLFDLTGRVDIYHAFMIAIGRSLKATGTAGIIVSNRFMTTRGGASVRSVFRRDLSLRHIWDLGDTKIFDAAVLPAVILVGGSKQEECSFTSFTSIYETGDTATEVATDPIEALSHQGVVKTSDERTFRVRHGTLDRSGSATTVWRIATEDGDSWLATVKANTWGTFGDLGKIRVGVKTCADSVFIRSDWDKMEHPPELLRPLTTHHNARRFRAVKQEKSVCILYPHESISGRRTATDLAKYPNSRRYLEAHREVLQARSYLTEGGRNWYEIWVPQDPAAWDSPKLVFRDISERPTFWLDFDGTIVNGDCYWLSSDFPNADVLWLAAAVANSTFTEAFYDHRFNNKLYSGRRRFITQYVREFPLPDPSSEIATNIISIAREIYANADTASNDDLSVESERLVWKAFGLVKKSAG